MAAQEVQHTVNGAIRTSTNDTPIVVKLRQIGEAQDAIVNVEGGISNTTIGDFKTIIQHDLGIPASRQRLLFLGKLLQPDSATCSEFGLFHDCVVHLLQSECVCHRCALYGIQNVCLAGRQPQRLMLNQVGAAHMQPASRSTHSWRS